MMSQCNNQIITEVNFFLFNKYIHVHEYNYISNAYNHSYNMHLIIHIIMDTIS